MEGADLPDLLLSLVLFLSFQSTQFGRSPMGHQGQGPHAEGHQVFSNSPILLNEQKSNKKKYVSSNLI